MKNKKQGISLIIAIGSSLLVLFISFSTLDTIGKALDQAYNVQRSTQAFFASESGIEAAFFHHNARGPGLNLVNPTSSKQQIYHDSIQTQTEWQVVGRTSNVTSSPNNFPFLAGVIRENESVQISYRWDNSDEPDESVNMQDISRSPDNEINVTFYADTDDMDNVAEALVEAEYGNVSIPTGFDFGDTNNEILFDWSISRNSDVGVETFIPDGTADRSDSFDGNVDCNDSITVTGFICDNQINSLSGSGLFFGSNSTTIHGSIRPTGTETTLTNFWGCLDGTGCGDYKLTIRPVLKFIDTDGTVTTSDDTKIIGIPYMISTRTDHFPKPVYTVIADVSQEDFSQRIELDVREKTAIGAFNYVIFD